MKLRTTDELWILDGEIGPPWFRFRDGSGALGMEPRSKQVIKIPRGSIIYVDIPENHDTKARVPLTGRGMDTLSLPARLEELDRLHTDMYRAGPPGFFDDEETHAELLAAMGHERKQDLCCECACKGCGSGAHCYDARCYPL